MEKKIQLPLDEETILSLHAGDTLLLTGSLITGRDAAHQRLFQTLNKAETLPIELKGETIYNVGPAPARPAHSVGSAGPTSSYRMDPFTPALLDAGLKGIIGKGDRCQDVIDALVRNKAVYFAAIGGIGALLAQTIIKSEILAYEDLGTEAIHRFWIEDFPVVVAIDAYGNNLYQIEQAKYREA